jgi:hypothetical protein
MCYSISDEKKGLPGFAAAACCNLYDGVQAAAAAAAAAAAQQPVAGSVCAGWMYLG